MEYRSTRGKDRGLTFRQALMTGLAQDGGLLLPAEIPDVRSRLDDWSGLPYADLAAQIVGQFADDMTLEEITQLTRRAYDSFSHPAITPLVSHGDLHVLELFHGPTLAFKDIALQLIGHLFEHVLAQDAASGGGGRLNVLGATSGDTGSAAIAGLRGRAGINIFIMFPEGRTSVTQERQMTTVLDDNVFNLSVAGSFDDCQRLLKCIFGDLEFRDALHLGAVNSVNWARVLAQIVYYFSAWYQLGRPARFDVAVPTGNFGNIFAGYLARRMGLPVDRLILATNDNDILARFYRTGTYRQGEVRFTCSPAMDIQVASNFERYLFCRLGEDPEKVRDFMRVFAREGRAFVPVNTEWVDDSFRAGSAGDAETLDTIAATYRQHGYLVCPHTAVGLHVAERFRRPQVPMVCLATAHPAKFGDTMSRALPDVAVGHPLLDALEGLPHRKTPVAADEGAVKAFIEQAVAAQA